VKTGRSRTIAFQIDAELEGKRIDTLIADAVPELSRARAQRLIESDAVRVAGRPAKASQRGRLGDDVEVVVPDPVASPLLPEAIPLTVLHEDRDVIVIDKPAGLVVHPAVGHRDGTLVNALLHHCQDLSGIGGVLRPGIVHRLDKGTSGVLVCAKNDEAHRVLAAQFKLHSVDREYLALVRGSPNADSGEIDAPIGRHPTDRKKFSTRARTGREAFTEWRVERRLPTLTLLRVRLRTGRTHQIRVHLAASGLPVLGDPVYGGGRALAKAFGLERQALHAAVLGFDHPGSAERCRFESGLPADLQAVLEAAE